MKHFKFTMSSGEVRYVSALSTDTACKKLTGMRVSAAMMCGRLQSIIKLED